MKKGFNLKTVEKPIKLWIIEKDGYPFIKTETEINEEQADCIIDAYLLGKDDGIKIGELKHAITLRKLCGYGCGGIR